MNEQPPAPSHSHAEQRRVRVDGREGVQLGRDGLDDADGRVEILGVARAVHLFPLLGAYHQHQAAVGDPGRDVVGHPVEVGCRPVGDQLLLRRGQVLLQYLVLLS